MTEPSRRDFLRLSALGLGGALLAACGVNVPVAPASLPSASVELANKPDQPAPTREPAQVPSAATAKATKQPAAGAKPRGKNPAPAPATTEFIAAEIAGRPTDSSVAINVVPATAMTVYYEYGMSAGSYTEKTAPQAAPAGAPLETLIGGLQPGTRYYYRMRYDDASGQEHTFVTQRPAGSAFTFAIQGDSHPERVGKQFDAGLYRRTLLKAAADQLDFYLTIGDDFSVDQLKTVNAETVRALYISQRQYLGLVGAPVYLVNGNHEQAALANYDGTPNNVAVWAQTARNAYYPQPAPDGFYSGDVEPLAPIGLLRDYYAFTWGDALFVVIDPYWHSPQTVDNAFGADHQEKGKRDLWAITLGSAQYQWLQHTLETSAARYKFVFAHHVNGTGRGGIELAGSYEWGDSAAFASRRPGWSAPIHQLMARYHVTIFFQGHDHIFVRQELDGVIYQTLPEPANPYYTYENRDAYQSGDKYPNSGYVRATVSPGGVMVDYIRTYLDKDSELAFTYRLP